MKVKRFLTLIILALSFGANAQRIELLTDSSSSTFYTRFVVHNDSVLYALRTVHEGNENGKLIISRKVGPVFLDIDSMLTETVDLRNLKITEAFFIDETMYIIGPKIRNKASNQLYSGALSWNNGTFGYLDTTFSWSSFGAAELNGNLIFTNTDGQSDSMIIYNPDLNQGFEAFRRIKSSRAIKIVNDTIFIIGQTSFNGDEKVYQIWANQLIDSFVFNCDSAAGLMQSGDYVIHSSGANSLITYHNGIKDDLEVLGSSCDVIDVEKVGDDWYVLSRERLQKISSSETQTQIYNIEQNFYGGSGDLVLFEGELYITGRSSAGKSFIGKVFQESVTEIYGHCFFDINKNCLFDLGDVPADKFIGLIDEEIGTRPSVEGFYQLFISEEGSYSMTSELGAGYSKTCVLDTVPFDVEGGDTAFLVNIPLSLEPNPQEYQLSLSSGIARRGERLNVRLSVKNALPADLDSFQTYFSFDSNLSNIAVTRSFSPIKSGYRFSSPNTLAYKETDDIIFSADVDETIFEVGDTLRFIYSAEHIDLDASNNQDTLVCIVQGPHDPNQKVSFPSGAIASNVRKVRYKIEFQNEGPSYATKVVIVDTIDARLPLKDIRVVGTSHPHSYELTVKNNVLIWTFNPIYLPSKYDDVQGSKGYVEYDANLLSDLKIGERIINKAFIYFDYEDPIVTNDAIIYIDSIPPRDTQGTSSEWIFIYPNPSNGDFTLVSRSQVIEEIEIFDLNGKLVETVLLQPEAKLEVSLPWLSPGMYILRSDNGKISKFIKQ
ncbi:T9SS type A sorting domain-containing protein [bacterium]|nr:T9SS type A sorting domain-containing protein [bacterium]